MRIIQAQIDKGNQKLYDLQFRRLGDGLVFYRGELVELQLTVFDSFGVSVSFDPTDVFRFVAKDPANLDGPLFLFDDRDNTPAFTDLANGKVGINSKVRSTALEAFILGVNDPKKIKVELIRENPAGTEQEIILNDLSLMAPDLSRGAETTTTTT